MVITVPSRQQLYNYDTVVSVGRVALEPCNLHTAAKRCTPLVLPWQAASSGKASSGLSLEKILV